MAGTAVSGGREAHPVDIKSVPWSSMRMPKQIFLEEFYDFVHMGMSLQEIARAFETTMDALEHRLRRYKAWPPRGIRLERSHNLKSHDGFGSRISPQIR